jgi:hypothetical protein
MPGAAFHSTVEMEAGLDRCMLSSGCRSRWGCNSGLSVNLAGYEAIETCYGSCG